MPGFEHPFENLGHGRWRDENGEIHSSRELNERLRELEIPMSYRQYDDLMNDRLYERWLRIGSANLGVPIEDLRRFDNPDGEEFNRRIAEMIETGEYDPSSRVRESGGEAGDLSFEFFREVLGFEGDDDRMERMGYGDSPEKI